AVFVCLAVILLDRAYGFGGAELPAPQATLMKLVIEGIFDSELPWGLVGIGAGIAIVIELLRIPSLPFAVGVYLPVGTTFTVFLGGMLRYFMEKGASNEDEKSERREKGILFGSGLVGGEGLLGVVIAGAVFILGHTPEGFGTAWAGSFAWIIAVLALGGLGYLFLRRCVVK
ncbi:MAG: OPT/YSL family transporter, partial [bacterium]